MDLVEIDPLDPKAPQRGLAGADQIVGAGIVGDAHFDAALGGQHHGAPEGRRPCQYPPKQRLGGAEGFAVVGSIDICGVQQIYPDVEGGLDQGRRGG